MSLREGTRRKKISVLHMLGTWEGKIDGCNCPSCKEYDEEQVASAASKHSAKVNPKTARGSKGSPKKTVIKVKTTKVVLDAASKDLIGRRLAPKKTPLSKGIEGNLVRAKSLNSSQGFDHLDCSDDDDDPRTENMGCVVKKECDTNDTRITELSSLGLSDVIYCKESKDSDNDKEVAGSDKELDEKTSLVRNADLKAVQKVYFVPSSRKNSSKAKRKTEETPPRPVQVKQEPEEFFSDEEDFDRDGNGRLFDDGIRPKKRARMVTSEMENMYAKPRMVFTGKGVVKKFEPGIDKTPKSRRGRKPAKALCPVKVKQEPKDIEDTEESELDQLQKALTEAAESLDVGDDLFDALNEFDDEPSQAKMRKKAKFKMLKRVESDGDKYVECNMCFKMLKESSMKQHYKTHTGEKPHICDECDARFTRKGDVERHKRLVHKNQKPFKCRKCKRNFSDRKNLKLHLQNHDKAIYYACNTCNFKFGKREYYENHIRYIHPLPDGSMPVFGDMDQDIAMEQLQEIEKEEDRERYEKEGKKDDTLFPIKSEIESIDNEEEEGATEITVTEGAEENPKTRKFDSIQKNTEGSSSKEVQNLEVSLPKDTTEVLQQEIKPDVGTDINVYKGTLSFTQTVSDTGSQDEELVDKVIADAVNQAANTIESLQTIAGANMSGNVIDFDDDDEDVMEEDEFQEILDSGGYDIIPIAEQKPVEQPSEIHINTSVGGQKKRFIIQVPNGSNLNVQTPEGMELIVSMVNQLIGGKGDLDGPIEVVMQNPGTRTVSFE